MALKKAGMTQQKNKTNIYNMKSNTENLELTSLSLEECMAIDGGGFFRDAGYAVGSFLRGMWEQAKEYDKQVYSVGPGVPV